MAYLQQTKQNLHYTLETSTFSNNYDNTHQGWVSIKCEGGFVQLHVESLEGEAVFISALVGRHMRPLTAAQTATTKQPHSHMTNDCFNVKSYYLNIV